MPFPTVPSTSTATELRTGSGYVPTAKAPSAPAIFVTNEIGQTHQQIRPSTTSAYRQRYASYLAATFGISLQAALDEADTQLAPRRKSDVSEAEVYRV